MPDVVRANVVAFSAPAEGGRPHAARTHARKARRACPPVWAERTIFAMWVSLLVLMLALLAFAAAGAILLTQRRRQARQLYQRRLESALADGTLSHEEIAELEGLRAQKDLTQQEVRMVARAIYRGALRDAMRDDRLSAEEDEALRHLQVQLGLSEHDLGSDLVHLSRLRMLARVESGDLPRVDSPVALVPHEICHWVLQCTLADELDLPRRPRNELIGSRMAVAGTDAFRADPDRSELRPSERILPVDLGILVVTSRRTVFQGAKRTLTTPHARVEEIALYRDGLRLRELNGQARAYLLVDDAELTAAILLQAARRRRVEIRPTRSGRSA